jgi:hypothetical protein
MIRSEATEFRYEREQQPMPRLGAWRAQLDAALASNEAKPSRERLTLIRVFEELRGLRFTGGYDAVRRYARGWGRERAATTSDAFVPLSFAPGEAYQFDWSHEAVLIAGATVTVTVTVAHLRLCHSRMLFARAYPRSSWSSRREPGCQPRRESNPSTCATVPSGGLRRGCRNAAKLPSLSAIASQAAMLKASCWSPVRPARAKPRLRREG